ncbi:hypothetical protein BD309DRAFT_956268 [Dichomitus squalens]|uniref:Uncharacterized protein n=1 Tax=Dichomitus squalens TaxID=114155 RepID=A0A4Q9PIZ3_9APHY|nr:hypothetical protein BD309DRAFT_956268 [Dichomitus squalens]TBU54049.1 hypothetical protein BD310DRAFT_936770 [Dichomitus squalens]
MREGAWSLACRAAFSLRSLRPDPCYLLFCPRFGSCGVSVTSGPRGARPFFNLVPSNRADQTTRRLLPELRSKTR